MNMSSKKRVLSVAAAVALIFGTYLTVDGIAHAMMGDAQGHYGMMGTTGYQGMGPGMMGTTGYQGMGPGMMGTTGSQGMGPGMMGTQQGTTGFHGWGAGMSGGHMMGTGPMGFTKLATDTDAVERYLTNIKERLGVTAAQETAWNDYAETIKSQITTHTDVHNTMHGTVSVNPLDRTQQHLDSMGSMIEQNKAVFQAFRTLYAQLTPSQQQIAAEYSTGSCHDFGGTNL